MLLPNKNSAGCDELSTVLFNKSLNEGAFPSLMKTAKVMALYKANECYLLSDYRLISLLIIM